MDEIHFCYYFCARVPTNDYRWRWLLTSWLNRHVNGKIMRYVWKVIVIFSRFLYLKLNTLQTLYCPSTASHNEVNTFSYRSVSHCMGMKLTNLRQQLARAFHGMFVTIYNFRFGNKIFEKPVLLTPLSYTTCNYAWLQHYEGCQTVSTKIPGIFHENLAKEEYTIYT